jgi:endoglucanase
MKLSLAGLIATAVVLTSLSLSPAIEPARAGVANGGIAAAHASDPLVGLAWGNYTGGLDEVFPAYDSADGVDRQLLALIALRPRVRWFGAWYLNQNAERVARDYIANVTGGQPNVLVQMAVFRLVPWEKQACQSLPDRAQIASYKQWINSFAAGIGDARVALILQPDLPFALCAPGHSTLPLQLVDYAARVFAGLPYTTVYIDAGAKDWESIAQAAYLLQHAGVRYARGFALNDTHYDSNEREIEYGAQIVAALYRRHLPGKHFVINTASNGRPFTYQQYRGPDFDNAAACRTRRQVRCVTLGIPPTTDVVNPNWGLSPSVRATAGRLLDAFLWIGRPWLDNQADPFDLNRSLLIAGSTPF